MMGQNSRLDFLKRKNAGQRRLPELRKALALALDILPTDVNFLPLEESDAVREQASHAFPPRNELEGRAGNYPFVSRRIRNAKTSKSFLPETECDVLLLLPEADMVGVLRLPLAIVNAKWSRLLDAKSDGFILVDTAFLNQTVAQLDQDETSGDVILDLAAWGTVWSQPVRNFPE